MFGPGKVLYGAIAAVCLLGAGSISATTVNFSTALSVGNLPESVTVGGITVSGWDVSKTNGTQWSNNVILDNRREGPDDLGLGVCTNPKDCPKTGNGDINEIDNNGNTFEVIRLDFGASTVVQTIGLSSLDSGLKDGFAIFGSNTALPNLSKLTPLAEGTNLSEKTVTPIITLDDSYRYFFVTSLDRSASDCGGSDFLLESVSTGGIHTTNTPEPYTAGMLAMGLIGLAAYRLASNSVRQKS
jgi:hypothetical protein